MKWLIRLYPPRWRQRYGDEFADLLQERPTSLNAILDVVAGALDAWLHPGLASPTPLPASAARARFDKFTPRSRTVLKLAEQEAVRLRHAAIGSEHLLLGLLLEGEGVAAHVLAEYGIDRDELRSAILNRLASAPSHTRPLGLNADAKRVIERSVAEANRLGHHYLGTEHLLLGLVAHAEGAAADLLRERNVADLAALQRRIVQVLTDGGPHVRPPA